MARAVVVAMEATIKVNEATVQRSTDLQSFERITAPFAGVITARHVERGDLVTADSTTRELFHLIRTGTLRVFVGCRKKPTVVVLDGKTGKEVVSIEIPGDIDDLFYDAKRERLYASCGDGFLAVIQRKETDRFEVIERIPTGKLARTCLFDSESGRLYLPIPRQPGKDLPELRIFQARP